MARRSLKPQLNQIRTWVRQGRTDAWIAHQLQVAVRVQKHGKLRFFTLVLVIIATAVVVTVVMFETLARVAG